MEIYSAWFRLKLKSANPSADESWVENCLDQLAEISYSLMTQDRQQRFLDVEQGYEKSILEGKEIHPRARASSRSHPAVTKLFKKALPAFSLAGGLEKVL